MPVVNDDWRDPATWKCTKLAYAVVKDGSQLRFFRATRSGQTSSYTCEVSAWAQPSDFRKRFEKERGNGALLVGGLAPHQVMIRSLESPLKDRSKSAEIWGTLLDAAIPFSLEKCQYTFLPLETSKEEGLRCLAVAARIEDLDDLLAEWGTLELKPDILFPEELMLPAAHERCLWLGEARSVFAAWEKGLFLGGGGGLDPEQRTKVLARFEQSKGLSDEWTRMGPSTNTGTDELEKALCLGVLKPGARHANLLANACASEKVQQTYASKGKTLKVASILLLMLLVLVPLTLRHQLRAYQNMLQTQLAERYTQITGQRSNAPGQELYLAGLYLDEQWGALWDPVEKLAQPSISLELVELSLAAEEAHVVFNRIVLRESLIEVNLLGSEDQMNNFASYLRGAGWSLETGVQRNGTWLITGERER